MSNTKGLNKEFAIFIVIILVAIFGLFYFSKIVNSILEALNLTKSDEEKQADKKLKDASKSIDKKEIFSAKFWKKQPYGEAFTRTKLITKNSAEKYAEIIFNSVGVIYDTPEQASGVFDKLEYQSQVSFLADIFFQKYNISLLDFLNRKFDTDEQRKILSNIFERVLNLPSGFINTSKK